MYFCVSNGIRYTLVFVFRPLAKGGVFFDPMQHIKLLSTIVEVPIFGQTTGICRITGEEAVGIPFNKWVSPTFTDHHHLHQGTIISNEAAFCFLEKNELIQRLTNRDKPQNFRTYSHIIDKDKNWHLLTKADKSKMVDLIIAGAKVVCLSETGQKHIFFKHKMGFWQQDDLFVTPDIEKFTVLHTFCQSCLEMGYNQTEIKTGDYKFNTINKIGLEQHIEIDNHLKTHRGTPFFDFTTWLMYSV